MYRDAMDKLIKWKISKTRKPLLLTGVRQCGKTYIVNEFGKKCFQNIVRINFEGQPKFSQVFDYDLDPERIVRELSVLTKEKIVPGDTLLFLDEIQECPKAITSLKYFCEDLRELHVIGAGSLLGVALKNESISFPVGKVNRIQLYPMSFREFVIASDAGNILESLRGWPADRMLPELISLPMEKLLKEYYIVGGMPEAVQTWIETHDIDAVEEVQEEILRDYSDDFPKHAPAVEVPKIRWIWDSVPGQLAKENNKFVFSHVKQGKRSAELENGLQWLKDAGLIYQLELAEKPEVPLSAFADMTYFKVYLSDIGLLRVRSNISAQTILEGNENYIKYKGAFAENYVMTELLSQGKTPYFWRSQNTAEIDFLCEDKESIIPIEVKAADNMQAKSYKVFCKKYKPKTGFKTSLKNIAENQCENTRTINLPLYMIWAMDQYL